MCFVEVEVHFHEFLTSALAGGETDSTPGRFIPVKWAPDIHCIRPHSRYGYLIIEKFLPLPEIELRSPVIPPLSSHYTDLLLILLLLF